MGSDEDVTRPLIAEEREPLLDSQENEITSLSSVGQPRVWTANLVIAISVAIIGGSLQFGFQTGCMANTQDTLKAAFKDNVSDLEMSLMISGLPIGGLFGGLLAGLIADKIGRKKCMLLNNIPILLGTVLMSVGLNEHIFLIGRILTGFGCGIATGVAPMYISEISPVSIKGAVGVSHQFMITFGILLGFAMSVKQALNWFSNYWHVYFAFPALPAFYQLILLPLCPESPNWLYYNKEREDLARAALTKLRKSRSVADEEVDAMIRERTSASSESVMVSYKELFTNRTLRLTLVIGLALQAAQQLSGINAILNYGPDILKTAGMKDGDTATGLLGSINVLMTLISIPLMDKMGRRSLMLLGQLLMILSYIGLAIAQRIHDSNPTGASWTPYVSTTTIITFIIFFAIGPGSIPWLIVAEIFTAEARGKASSLCVGANWICNLLVVLTYDKLNKALKPNTFFLYMGIVTFFLIFTFFFVPETKKKQVEQINREIQEQAEKFPPIVF